MESASLNSFGGWVFLTILLLFLLNPVAISAPAYYPLSFKNTFEQLKDRSLKAAIKKVLVSNHWQREGKPDVLVESCENRKKKSCYRQRVLSYRYARKILFQQLHLQRDEQGDYITDRYCGKDVNIKRSKTFYKKISCEHTWPRSKFNRKESQSAQNSDLHHLYPVDARVNGIRSNRDFGEGGDAIDNCNLSRLGSDTFEPPEEHKGNVARALFYFSIRYNAPINKDQEHILKIWHGEDPVDNEERVRNQKIYQIQRIRNPFIDFPQMVERISNF